MANKISRQDYLSALSNLSLPTGIGAAPAPAPPPDAVPPMLARTPERPMSIQQALAVPERYADAGPIDMRPKGSASSAPEKRMSLEELARAQKQDEALANFKRTGERVDMTGVRRGSPANDTAANDAGQAPILYKPPPAAAAPSLGGMGGAGGVPVAGSPGMFKEEEVVQRGPEQSAESKAAFAALNNTGNQLAELEPKVAAQEQQQKADELSEARRNFNEKRMGLATLEGRQAANMQAAEHQLWKAKDAYEHAPASISEMFNQKTTGGKIGMAIAMALSSFGAGWNHQENNALRNLDDSLKTDLGRKAHLIGLAREGIDKLNGKQKEEYAQAVQHYSDGLSSSISEVQRRAAADPNNPVLQKRAAELTLALQKQQAEMNAKRDEVYGARVTEKHTTGSGRGGGAGAGGPSTADAKWLTEQYEKAGIPQTDESTRRVMQGFANDEAAGTGAVSNALYEHSPWLYKQGMALLHGGAEAEAAVNRQQDWHGFRNDAIHQMTGAGVTGNDLERITSELDSANTPAERRHAAENFRNIMAKKQATIDAAMPASAAAFNQRRQILSPAPAPAAPPTASFNPFRR